MVVTSGGLVVPKRALDRWAVGAAFSLQNIVVVGDSLPQGTGIPGVNPGYLDGFVTRLQRALGNALGGNQGAGFFGLWRSLNTLGYLNSIGEWTFAGVLPTIAAAAGPFSLIPYQGMWQLAAAAANVATFTPPPNVAPTFVTDCITAVGSTTIQSPTAGFSAASVGQTIFGLNIPRNACINDFTDATHATISLPATGSGTGVLGMLGRQITGTVNQVGIWWADWSGGGTWSYSLDNGASWVNVASTVPANATLKQVLVTTTLPLGNIKIRAASAAGVAHQVFIAGVSLRAAVNPTAGVLVHNLTKDGGTWNNLDNGAQTRGFSGAGGSSDYWRLLDNAGDPTQQSLEPTLVIALFSNDCDLIQAGTIQLSDYTANIQAFISRMFPYCDLLIMNPMEQSRTATPATQAAMRAATKAVCVANGVAYLDIYDAWAAQGTIGFAACNADGLMLNVVHPSLEGHADIAGHVARLLATMAV